MLPLRRHRSELKAQQGNRPNEVPGIGVATQAVQKSWIPQSASEKFVSAVAAEDSNPLTRSASTGLAQLHRLINSKYDGPLRRIAKGAFLPRELIVWCGNGEAVPPLLSIPPTADITGVIPLAAISTGRVALHIVCFITTMHIGNLVDAAPPPGSNGQYNDWFQSLRMPGSHIICCDAADCRMVDARWNHQAQHFVARVVRDEFSDALRYSSRLLNNPDLIEHNMSEWFRHWAAHFGDATEVWIEIPEVRGIYTHNPTSRAVLCWSPDFETFDGVYCFVPYSAAFMEFTSKPEMYA
jgi:hypothetical protein